MVRVEGKWVGSDAGEFKVELERGRGGVEELDGKYGR